MVLVRWWHVRIQRWWHGEYGVLSHKTLMIVIVIVVIIIIVDHTSAMMRIASPLRHERALRKWCYGDR